MFKDIVNNFRFYKVEMKKVMFWVVRRVDRINNGIGKKDFNKKKIKLRLYVCIYSLSVEYFY